MPNLKPSAKPVAFRSLVRKHSHRVNEVLQLWGDFPECETRTADASDWLHVLMERMTELCEHCRMDECDPEVSRALRNSLSHIVATCEAWDKRLIAED